ncbi:hypothetical protein [Luteimonas saliphila]|uniref:hypothetical protein n=1 Tax=Luteimonas saliphila TaxID=2804919 RepID=UPI00192E0CCA|nr:hypothetical protein [Luteimonas saliphila]
MIEGRIRIEVQRDVDGGWSVTRNRIVDGCFSDIAAANDYASACAHRARRAGIAVELRTAPAETVPHLAA